MSITSVVSLAAGKIGELLWNEVKLLHGVQDQVRSLQTELEMVQSFLIDMEAMVEEEGGDERSRTTIKQIRKIAYDAEDVVESYILEANSSTDKKDKFLKRYICFCCSVPRTHQVGCEIEAIRERLNKIMEMWKKYADDNGMLGADARQRLNMKTKLSKMRPIAYSHTHEEHVVGLEQDINTLVGVLTHEAYYNINVVSLVGMGGSGKTTLARKLFNHEGVKQHFDCLAWVSVSQQWDAQKIIVNLLKKVTGETMGTDESSVQKLHQYLEMKRYLIVLDDVWESKALAHIRPALPLAGDGRKIIVTTRNEEVVKYPDLRHLTYSHEPRRLTDEESWELFRRIAVIHRQEVNNSAILAGLKELGEKMLKKCRGLPLAVIALAGILCDKENLEEWEMVSKAVSSRIMEEGKGTQLYGPVKDMLALSYIDLPRELKPCFLYLARYPEDHYIPVGKLIRQWIAEGFITSTQLREGLALEDVARRYLDQLVHRCLVLVVERNYEGKVKCIHIHDLVRDLCIEKGKEEDFLEVVTPKTASSNTTMIEPRRVAFCSRDGNVLQFSATNSQHLHSILICGFDLVLYAKIPSYNLEAVHKNFSLLRVLVVEGVETCSSTLPTGIGSLIHLRYLGLRWTSITELPSSIGNLRNLLALEWSKITIMAKDVIRIPDVLWKLERLTHVSLDDILKVEVLKLHTLKLLQTLKMSVGGGNWMLKELPCLSPSIQKLAIHNIGSQELVEVAFRCPSIRSNRLHSLSLSWRKGITLQNYNLEEPIILGQHLRKLRLVGRMAEVGIQFPANITKLVLWSTGLEAEATLVALGQLPHLTLMTLANDAFAGKQWICRAGEFPQLKRLSMKFLGNWEEWSIESGAMPQFVDLTIYYCQKLRKLPEGLKFITTLQHFKVSAMGDEFIERIKMGGEDAHIIQHVPLVEIT